jgi:hypothetical protein
LAVDPLAALVAALVAEDDAAALGREAQEPFLAVIAGRAGLTDALLAAVGGLVLAAGGERGQEEEERGQEGASAVP